MKLGEASEMATEILQGRCAELDQLIAEAMAEDQSELLRRNPGMMLHLVRWTGGIKIEVFSDEHPPPHFRLKHKNKTANYKIADCKLMNGSLRLPDRAVRKWWRAYREEIAEAWNKHRPADCSVGTIDTETLGW